MLRKGHSFIMAARASRVVLITGANRGLGRGTVERLLVESPEYRVIMTARKANEGQRAMTETSRLGPSKTGCSSIRLISQLHQHQYKDALKVLSVHYQYTMDFPLCLTSLGEVYEASSRPVEAEEQWVQACEVFHAHYPRTLEFACCLCRLGVLYCSSKRLGFAEDLWLKA
jgi:NAD(P)-dependent dehydrogenase (short-subunit alcohol dehydrogenase family)